MIVVILIYSYLLGKNQEVIRSQDRIVESISFFEDYFEIDILHEVQKKEFISEPTYSSGTAKVNCNDSEIGNVSNSSTSVDNKYQKVNNAPLPLNIEVDDISLSFTDSYENINCRR